MTGLRDAPRPPRRSRWLALAVAMGVGRFAYTPILPLMTGQAGLTAETGAGVATPTTLVTSLAPWPGTLAPGLVRSHGVPSSSLVLLIGTLATMPLTTSTRAARAAHPRLPRAPRLADLMQQHKNRAEVLVDGPEIVVRPVGARQT